MKPSSTVTKPEDRCPHRGGPVGAQTKYLLYTYKVPSRPTHRRQNWTNDCSCFFCKYESEAVSCHEILLPKCVVGVQIHTHIYSSYPKPVLLANSPVCSPIATCRASFDSECAALPPSHSRSSHPNFWTDNYNILYDIRSTSRALHNFCGWGLAFLRGKKAQFKGHRETGCSFEKLR